MTVGTRGAIALGAPEARKNRVVHARFSTSELAAIDAAAKAAGLTVSAFLRSLTLEGAGVRPFLVDEDRAVFDVLTGDIQALGVSLNHVARSMRATGVCSASDLSPSLIEVQKLLVAVVLELRYHAARGAHRRLGRA